MTRPAVRWPALAVSSWKPTHDTLHMWLQIVGKFRMNSSPPINHWWHATLRVTARGLSTGAIPMPDGRVELAFDFIDNLLHLRRSDGRADAVELRSRTVADFYGELIERLRRMDVVMQLKHPVPNEVEVAIPFADNTVNHSYDPTAARLFWEQLLQADRLFEQFRAEYLGKVSPVHFFWGAMDLAVTRFSGRTAPLHPGGAPNCPDWVMHDGYSHEISSAGFWPGGGEEGAFYAYAYPTPDGYTKAAVPQGAFYSEKLGEFLLPYETVRTAEDPDKLVLDFLRATQKAAATLGHWDPALLKEYRPDFTAAPARH